MNTQESRSTVHPSTSGFRLQLLMAAACAALIIPSLPASAADKTSAVALTTLKQSNDRLVRFTLDNGLTCLLKEDHSSPVVSIQIWVGTGSIHEGSLLGSGLSHYVEHMVFKGTATQKPGEMAKALIGMGGELNAYTSLDRTVYFTDLPSRNWKEALAKYADGVINTAFPETEWRQEKDVILREMSMRADDPEDLTWKLLLRTAYTIHPFRLPVIGLSEIFKANTRDDLTGYYHRRYVPDNIVAVLVGDIQITEAKDALTKAFAAMPRRPNPQVYVPQEPRQIAPRFVRQAGPYKVSRLVMGFHTVSQADPDAPALDLLASITGGSQSSCLVQDIKETRKLVHGISANSFILSDPGLFIIGADLDPTKENEAFSAIADAVAAWSKTPFPKDEVEKAKRIMLVDELSKLQSMHGQASSLAEGELFMHNPRYSENYLERLQALTATDLQTVARKYFTAENRTTVVLGPESSSTGAIPAAMSQPSAVTKRKLPNGVSLILREDHRLPFIYVSATFMGGVITEDENTSGITQLMSDLLVRGTPTRTAVTIATTLESKGAHLGTFSGLNSFGLQGQCLSGDINTLMDVMFDCLGHASFPTNEVEKQKVVQLAAIDTENEQPTKIARDGLNRLIFAGNPCRLPPLGRRESVTRLDQSALLDYYRRQTVTGNMTLAIFGDITAENAQALAIKYAHHVRQDRAPARLDQPPKPVLPARIEKTEPRDQCIVFYGFPGVPMFDSRADALSILEAAMGGMSSRLFETVRNRRGLAYYATSAQRMGLDSGIFMMYAGTRIDALAEVEQLFRAEIERVTTKGLDADEIARARTMVIAQHEMRLEDNAELARMCALDEMFGLGYGYEFTARKRIEGVTADQIKQAAISILSTNRMAVSVVLPKESK